MEEIIGITDIEPKGTKFERSETGVLKMTLADGTVHPRIYPICSFPVENPDKLISIRSIENKEIGMIKDLGDFPADQQALIRKEIKLRYFVPVIREIYKITEEFGIYNWETKTDRGRKAFYVRGRNDNILMRGKTRLLITDIEECRYEIPDYARLPRHSLVELDKVL